MRPAPVKVHSAQDRADRNIPDARAIHCIMEAGADAAAGFPPHSFSGGDQSMKQFRFYLFAGVVVLYMLSLLIVPAEYAAAVRGSITSCLENIVPSLFLFMVATQICMEYGILSRLLRPFSGVMRLLRLPPAAFEALVIGNVAGFPMGARVACRLYTDGRLERGQAERLLAFCNNCGPAFLIGAVGAAIWGDAGLGVALWGVQLAASLVVGLLFRGRRETYAAAPGTQRDAPRLRRSFSAAFVAAVKNSAVSVLYVCAFIVFMSCASVILRFGGFSTRLGAFEGLLLGVFEITMGIGALPGRSALAFAMACAIAGFGGLSVHCQTLLFTEGAGLRARKYFLGKTLQGAISFPLGFGIYRLLCGDATVFAGPDVRISPAPVIHILIIVAIACIGIVFLHRILFPEK